METWAVWGFYLTENYINHVAYYYDATVCFDAQTFFMQYTNYFNKEVHG